MYQFSHPTLNVLKLDLPCNSESWLCWSSQSNIKLRIGNDENQSSNSDTKCLCAHFYFLLTTLYVTVGKCQPKCCDSYVQVFACRAPFSKKMHGENPFFANIFLPLQLQKLWIQFNNLSAMFFATNRCSHNFLKANQEDQRILISLEICRW
jgi:hypothetical protein